MTDRTANDNTGVVCPHCGAQNDDEDGIFRDHQIGGDDCIECGKPFEYEVDWTCHFYAWKTE